MHTEDDYELDIGTDTDEVDARATPRHYPCNHRHMTTQSRCLGCGRTRNEILLDER